MIVSFLFFLLKPLLLYLLVKISFVIYRKFIRKPYDLLKRYGEKSYVIVTGATDGIGKEFCNQFAKLGFNLILVSRNMEKLIKVSTEFKEKYSIDVKYIQFDFTKKTSMNDYISLFESNEDINKLDISVLINNIGISQRELYSKYTLQQVADSINVNVVANSYLTHIFLNRFLQRKKQCAIISMSSYSGTMPLMLSSMYCSTKIFDDFLLRSIAAENKGKKIDFLSVRPLYVDTPSRAGHKKEFGPISAEQCVKGVMQDLGYDTVTNGHWRHCLQAVIFDLAPVKVKNFFRYMGSKNKFKED